ncbi:autotransporter family protein [Thiomicrorhabdus lithotrophica]|uniref:Autotransporter domain-containing protein n=1 Tax=Thiomicrorhabdus lithotrophica TaxID=2949997 RepID=A0ABY8C914_9GAMM|nr:autotransporter outer membrane beta-barrel domain-containing protein [Thiomicrorhabdus lithotrophica]WEJ62440.1 autotransporter domain-containing protein [Thiomicrorhabdus lithotrophica]
MTDDGTNALVKTGTGTLTLSGVNTYSGTTSVDAGTLSIASDSNLGGGALTLNGGNLTVTGATTIDNAITLGAANGTFNTTADTSFSGIISGTGNLTKAGAGRTTLTGANTYNGVTSVNAGILSVNGSIANSNTTVNTGGTLGGSGTVGNVTINNGGTFAPGNSIGTINVTGDVAFSAGSNYNVEVDAAGNSDKIIATGTATLTGATVNVQPEAGTYAATTDYTILTAAGGLGGTTFGSVNSNLAFLTPTLSYDANNVLLNLTRNDISFNSVASTPNQAAVSAVLDNNTTALQSIVSSITPLTDTGAQQAFDSLSGVQHSHSSQIALQSVNQFQGVLFDRIQGNNSLLANNGTVMLAYNDRETMNDAGSQLLNNSVDTQRGWWLRAIGNEGKIDSTTNASGTEYKAGGIATGFDDNLTDDLTIGTALGFTSANADVEQGRLNADSYQLALYGKLHLNNDYYVSGTAGIGTQKTKASRNVTVGLSNLVAKSDYDATTANVAIEGGRQFTLNENTHITPFAGLEYTHVNRDGFTETGAGSANLKVNSDYQESLRSVIGTRIAHSWTTKQGYHIQPTAELAWVNENMDNKSILRAGFEPATNTSFTVYGPELNRDHARVGLGVNVQLNDTATLNLAYQGEVASSDERHDVTATFRMEW